MEEKEFDAKLSPAKLLDLYISGHGLKGKWIADYLGVTPAYISMIRSESCTLTNEMREKINQLLETSF